MNFFYFSYDSENQQRETFFIVRVRVEKCLMNLEHRELNKNK